MYPLAYQQQPRGLKISGANNGAGGITGTGNDTVVAFSAAAAAAITNLGSWPIASWCTVTTSDVDGAAFQITRQGIYEVRYSIPWVAGAAGTIQAGISVAAPNSQLIIDPDATGVTIFQTSSCTADAATQGVTLTGAAKVLVRSSELTATPARPASIVRLQASDGADGVPPTGSVIAQVTLWITQVNHLNG